MSLLGNFLVRSGVLTSVHAFATDPARGVFILGLLVALVGGALILYAIRAPSLRGGGLFAPISREGALVLNNLLLTTAAAVVLIGTLYPLVLDAFGGGKVSVGAPFFNATFVPLMGPVLIAAIVGAMLSWKRGDLAAVLGRLKVAFGATLLAVIATAILKGAGDILAALGMGLAAWLVVGAGVELAERIGLFRVRTGESWRRFRALPRSALGMAVAHGALGLTVAGITASSAWQTEVIRTMKPGDVAAVGAYELKLEGVSAMRGPNYAGQRASFTVTSGGKPVTVLSPEKRNYPAERSQTTEAAIRTTLAGDLYAVIGDAQGDGSWTVRLYFNPLVAWIWIGCIVMAAGGAISLTDRRHRIGAPVRARGRAPADGAPA
jgi:cytochrome c-type biogenesis protein CcmF